MADEIQKEDLQNAKLDTITIAQVTNVGTLSDTVTNRDGVIIDTLLGRLKLIGFLAPEVYAGGINFAANDNVKTISRNGIAYYPIPEQLPFTTSGTWAADDETKFYVLQTGSTVTVAADSVSVTDTANYYTGSDAETILQEVGLSRQSIADSLGVSVDDDNMGSYTGPYLTDDQPAKQNIQELSEAIETIANSTNQNFIYHEEGIGNSTTVIVNSDNVSGSNAYIMDITGTIRCNNWDGTNSASITIAPSIQFSGSVAETGMQISHRHEVNLGEYLNAGDYPLGSISPDRISSNYSKVSFTGQTPSSSGLNLVITDQSLPNDVTYTLFNFKLRTLISGISNDNLNMNVAARVTVSRSGGGYDFDDIVMQGSISALGS